MDYAEIAQKYETYNNPAFIRLLNTFGYGRLFVRAEGCWVWDSEGRKYLDFVSGYGSMNLGHNHPRIHAKIKAVLDQNPYHFLHFGPSAAAAKLGEELANLLGEPFRASLFSGSGSEAVEAAMKLACAVTGRSRFVYAKNAFHGTGIGSLSAMGAVRHRKPFEKMLLKNKEVPFGDLASLSEAVQSKEFAAVILEPVQCEGGVVFPPENYLDQVLEICRKTKTLFVLDEVQTGLGRTGRYFSFQAMKGKPDVIVLAKSLSGGVMPIAATVTRMDLFKQAYGTESTFDLHGSTFGGNALSCEVACETLQILKEERLVENAAAQGQVLLSRLRAVLGSHPLVRDVRGEGLLIAVEMGAGEHGVLNRLAPVVVDAASKMALGQWISYRLLEKGVLLQPASHTWNVLKCLPPLSIQSTECEFFLQAIHDVFDEASTCFKATKDMALHLARRQWGSKEDTHVDANC